MDLTQIGVLLSVTLTCALGVNTLFNLYDGAGILLAQRGLEELGLISRQGPDSS